ncbi:MAG: phosphoribosylglycinamide formyltransferase [Firmicutes bacterium]|nr:phosphoribosylglycinamide formyltransferase [Bacillota bacterium]
MRHPKKLGILVSGGGSNLQAVLDACAAGEINGKVVAVISSNPEAYALTRTKNSGVPAYIAALKNYASREARDAYILEILKKHEVDYVVLAGYLGILTEPLVKAFERRMINIHPALLPKFGGAGLHGLNVHKAVIAAGEKKSGATVHFVDLGIDSGEIIAQESLDVLPSDTPETLQARILSEIEHKLLVCVVKGLCEGSTVE